MRAMVLGGILIIAFGNTLPVIVDGFTTRHAIQLIGLGTALVLGGIAVALADIATAIREKARRA